MILYNYTASNFSHNIYNNSIQAWNIEAATKRLTESRTISSLIDCLFVAQIKLILAKGTLFDMKKKLLRSAETIVLVLLSIGTLTAMQLQQEDIPLSENQRKLESGLRWAIDRANPTKVKELIAAGADPNGFEFRKDPDHEETFLNRAVAQHYIFLNDPHRPSLINQSAEVMRELINAGANPNFKNKYNKKSALEFAIEEKYPQSIITMLSGKEPDTSTPDTYIPVYKQQWWLDQQLMEAINNDDRERVTEILAYGANPNRIVQHPIDPAAHDTLLTHAIKMLRVFIGATTLFNSRVAAIEELLKAGADPSLINSDNENAVDIAKSEHLPQAIIDLLSRQEKG